MKQIVMLLAVVCAGASAQGAGDPPAKNMVVPTQRIGDLVIQGGTTPTWLVRGGSAPIVIGQQVVVAPPPSRLATPVPTDVAPAVQQTTPPKRMTSADWKTRVEQLSKDIDSARSELEDAKVSRVNAATDEQRQAEEQVAIATRRLNELKRQAEVAASTASQLRGVEKREPIETVISAAPVVIEKPVQAPIKSVPVFELKRSDQTVAAALYRWAEVAKYDVLWEAKDERVFYEDRYEMPLPDAIDKVIKALRIAGSNLQMCEYDNPVIRIISSRDKCVIPTATNISQNTQLGATE